MNTSFDNLPHNMLIEIAGNLDVPDLRNFSMSCKNANQGSIPKMTAMRNQFILDNTIKANVLVDNILNRKQVVFFTKLEINEVISVMVDVFGALYIPSQNIKNIDTGELINIHIQYTNSEVTVYFVGMEDKIKISSNTLYHFLFEILMRNIRVYNL